MTSFLDVPGGRLAYSDEGAGPLVVAIPGMGDLRSAYRFLASKLVEGGYRVVSLDIRGHGESSVTWDDYSVGAIAGDVLALVRSLNAGPAHLLGNSMAAGAAVVAAAREPKWIRSLTLIGPFVRDTMPLWVVSALAGTLLSGPWALPVWRLFFRNAFPSRRPVDFDDEWARHQANLEQAGRFAAFRRMLVASKRESERRIAEVTAPVLVLMGSRDSDFANPVNEAQHVAGLLHGSVVMIDGAGHYPQAEMPDAVAASLMPFLNAADAASQLDHAS